MITRWRSSTARAKPSSLLWASVLAARSCCNGRRKPALFSMAAITACRMTLSSSPSPFFRIAWLQARATPRFRENRRRPNPSLGRSSTPFAYLCESSLDSRATLGQSRPLRRARFLSFYRRAGCRSAPRDLFRHGSGVGPFAPCDRLRARLSGRRRMGGCHARSGTRQTDASSLDRLQNGVPSHPRRLDIHSGYLFGGRRCPEHRQQSSLSHSRESDRHYLDVRRSFFDHSLRRRDAPAVARAHLRGSASALACRGTQRKADAPILFSSC